MVAPRLYHLGKIRELLLHAFSVEELRRLCFDTLEFRPVYDELASKTGKAELVDLLLEYADRNMQVDTLLAEAQRRNPSRYDAHGPYNGPHLSAVPQESPVDQVWSEDDAVQHPLITRLRMTIDMDLKDFDDRQRRWLQHGLAQFLGIPLEAIRIMTTESGSVHVTIELPTQNAKDLLSAYEHTPWKLASSLRPLALLDVGAVESRAATPGIEAQKPSRLDEYPTHGAHARATVSPIRGQTVEGLSRESQLGARHLEGRRVFRRHWLTALIVPGLPWLIAGLLLSVVASALLPRSPYVLLLFVPAVYCLIRVLGLFLEWASYSVVVTSGSGALEESMGMFRLSVRRIPLVPVVPFSYSQPLWIQLLGLDIGDVTIVAMGGPYILRRMGDFSDLRKAIDSKGMIIPRQRRWWARFRKSAKPSHQPQESRTCDVVQISEQTESMAPREESRSMDRGPLSDGGYIYRGHRFSATASSKAGFLAFAAQFVLADRDWSMWHYRAQDVRRRYYPNGISEKTANVYLRLLRESSVLIPAPGGSGERLSTRIQRSEDIESVLENLSDKIAQSA